MTTTYTWTFGPLEHEERAGMTSVVTCIHWQVSGTDGTYEGRAIDTFGFPEDHVPDPAHFAAYETLTCEIVKSWLPAKVIIAAEATVQAEIDRKVAEAAKNKGAGVPW